LMVKTSPHEKGKDPNVTVKPRLIAEKKKNPPPPSPHSNF